MASQFVANLIRLEGRRLHARARLILALTADEEGGTFNGVDWLVKNHRDLIDAEIAINEGGGGTMRNGKYLTNEVQASEKVYQDFRLEVDERRRPQLAAGEGQRDLSPVGRRWRGSPTFEFPVELNEVTRAYFERSATGRRPIRRSPPTCAPSRSAHAGPRRRGAAVARRCPTGTR